MRQVGDHVRAGIADCVLRCDLRFDMIAILKTHSPQKIGPAFSSECCSVLVQNKDLMLWERHDDWVA
jgi:hypothetical protein